MTTMGQKPSLGNFNPSWKHWDRVVIMDECCFKLEENTSAEIRLLFGEKSEDYTDCLPRRTHAVSCIDFLPYYGVWMKTLTGEGLL